MKTLAITLAVGVVVAIAVAGRSAGSAASTIRIGVLSVCRGNFAPLYEGTLAGAQLALIHRGGRPAGSSPADGVRDVEIGGRPVELRLGCSDDTAEQALEEARRLVEQESVHILVGPATSAAGIAVREYARAKPNIAFVNASSPAAEVTQKRPARNVFRFTTHAIQWSAGLGAYAYRTLGWRTAVVVGSDFTYPYDEAAGFVAEFCSLGGTVEGRIWIPIGESRLAPFAARLRAGGADGYFLTFLLAQDVVRLAGIAPALRGALDRKVLLGAAAALAGGDGGLGARSLGVVAGAPLPIGSASPTWTRFLRDLGTAYPRVPFSALIAPYFNAMEASLRAVEAVGGDLSDPSRLLAALRRVELDSPVGHVRLDRNRQAIAPNYLLRVAKGPGGSLILRTIRKVAGVEGSYGGRFMPASPQPSRTRPHCTRGNSPPWARR